MERHTIVVGHAPAACGRLALSRAIEEARLRGSRLLVVPSMPGGRRTGLDEVEVSCRALEEAEARLQAEGVDYAVRELVRGKTPARDLADLAAEEKADLLVIGYCHRSKSGKYFLGSDAQDIVLAAPCPVLATRPPEGEED